MAVYLLLASVLDVLDAGVLKKKRVEKVVVRLPT